MNRLLPLLLACLCLGGCHYLRDRGRDACDVFTATVGYGLGAKARVGPFNAGVVGAVDWAGLRGGAVGVNRAEGWSGVDAELFLLGLEGMTAWPGAVARGKDYHAHNVVIGWAAARGPEERRPLINPYYTQVEVLVAVGGSLRLGVNPGELVDLLVGLVGLDLYNDDGVGPIDAGAPSAGAGVQGTGPDPIAKPFGDDPFGL